MKSNKKNSLNTKIWLYLAIFSLLILLFLWIFQIIFLSSYYEWHKTKDIKQLVKLVVTNYNTNDTDDFYNNLEKISFENGEFTYNDNKYESYEITLSWDYKKDLGYDKKGKVTIIKIEDKLYVVSYEGGEK